VLQLRFVKQLAIRARTLFGEIENTPAVLRNSGRPVALGPSRYGCERSRLRSGHVPDAAVNRESAENRLPDRLKNFEPGSKRN
jgi:hypothetical protein